MNLKSLFYKMNKTYYLAIFLVVVTFSKSTGQSNLVNLPDTYIDPSTVDLTKPTIFAIPYSHLDDQWRWAYPQVAREFIKNTLDDNFAYFDEYPNFNFNWTGAFRYQMMKEYYPEKYKELKTWIAKGRWFTAGSSWTENVVLAPSTESVVRQILMGSQYFKKEFGTESLEYMLPDCFGFPYSLPSVLNHCGIKGFSTQKLTWGSANGIPFNVGKWTGPDGKSVIAALNGGAYAAAHNNVYSNDEATIKRLKENEERSGLPIDFYYMGGGDKNNADRGGAPRKVNIENVEKSIKEEGPVRLINAQPDLMFTAITEEQASKFPVWNSDLLLVQHSTGVLTSQAYQKKLNRTAEILADASEKATVTAHLLQGSKYPYEALNSAWGLMLSNQFHDILPGTCIPEAHSYGWNDGIVALNKFDGVYKDAIGTLAKSLNTNVPGVPVVVYNQLSIPRKDHVEAFIPEELLNAASIAVYNADGKEVPSQVVQSLDGKKRIVFLTDLPAVGAAVYSIREAKSKIKSSELAVRNDYMENNRFKVTVDDNGDIASVFDKSIDKELLEKPIQLEFIKNFPDSKPAWRIYYKDIIKEPRSYASNPISLKVVENGPVRVAIEIVRENEGTKIWQRVQLWAGDDGGRVEVANKIDWKSRGTLLKAAFHMTAEAPEATYNLDLGVIKRGNRTEKQYEVPTHSWIDLTDKSGEYGVSILTGPKYGSDKVDDNTLRLTLIHGPDSKESVQEVFGDGVASEQRWQDWGRHEFTYGITGHKGDWAEGKLHKEAMRFEQRPSAFVVPKRKGKNSSLSLVDINTDLVNIQAVKMAEDGSGVVVRMQELYGKGVSDVSLSALKPIKSASKLDGAERPLNEEVSVSKGKINLSFKPYELKTILLNIPAAKPNEVLTTPLAIAHNADIFSTNEEPEDGYIAYGGYYDFPRPTGFGAYSNFDGKGSSYPAEMMSDKIQMGNVEFEMGSREGADFNAIECIGQAIELPEGTRVLHILAAADVDQDVVFKAGDIEIPVSVGGWSGHLGLWDEREFEGYVAELSYSLRNPLKTIKPAFYRDHRVAWSSTHLHRPTGDEYYGYSYFFAYRLEIPEGATSITLPDSRFVRIAAMSIGDEAYAQALYSPFSDLSRDEEFKKKYEKP